MVGCRASLTSFIYCEDQLSAAQAPQYDEVTVINKVPKGPICTCETWLQDMWIVVCSKGNGPSILGFVYTTPIYLD